MNVKIKNSTKGHFPLFDEKSFRSRCKFQGCTRFTHLFCEQCEVHLCITSKRNCFYEYHHSSQLTKIYQSRTAHQKKPTRNFRQIIETANIKEKRSERLRASLFAKNSIQKYRRIKQMKVISLGRDSCTVGGCIPPSVTKTERKQSAYNTRSKMYANRKRELMFIKNAASEKEHFMAMIGLVEKK